MWPIRLFAAVLLLPLAALAARTADGIARVAVARLRGAPPPPGQDEFCALKGYPQRCRCLLSIFR